MESFTNYQQPAQGERGNRYHPLSSRLLLLCLALVIGLLALELALTPWPLIFFGAGLTLAIGLALLDPVFGLYWVVLSVPVQETTILPGNFTYTQAALFLAVSVWAIHVLAHPNRQIVKGGLLPLWFAFLWALLLSTSLTPYSRLEAIKETVRWTGPFLTWLIAINTATKRWQIVGLVACLLVAPTVDAAMGIVQFLSGEGPPSFRIGTTFVRAYGTIGTPNAFAGYLNMAWPLAIALAIGLTWALVRGTGARSSEGAFGQRIASRRSITLWFLDGTLWAIAGVLLLALVASFSRGSWLGAAVGLVGMTLALGRWSARGVLVGIVVLGLALALSATGLLPATITQRLASIPKSLTLFDPNTVTVTPENFVLVERMSQLWAGWQMFITHPLTGIGPGNYSVAYPYFAVAPWFVSRGHAHNYYLHMAAEAGIVGFLTYLALLGGVIFQASVAVRRSSTLFWRAITIGCCGVIGAVAGHDLFENLHALNMGIQLAGVWALITIINSKHLGVQDQSV